MSILKRLFDFYINSSIHVALAVTSLTWLTYVTFNLKPDNNLLFFTFFSTISSYNFIKYFGLAKFHHRSLSPWLRQIQIFSFLCFLPLAYYAFQLEIKTLIYLAGLGAITFFYAMPLLPRKIFVEGGTNLRTISGLKIYVIALVWAVSTVIIPLINEDMSITHDAVITTLQRFLYVLVAMLPFEIRDMQYDSIKLSTIPQQIGIKQTKIIGIILLMPFFFLEYFKENVIANQIMILLIVMMMLLLLVVFSRTKQSKYYSSFWVEAVPIVWLVLSFLML